MNATQPPKLTATAVGGLSWEIVLSDHVSALAPAPNGHHVLAASFGGEALIVDSTDGTVTAKTEEHPFGASCAGWSADSSMIAVGGHDGVVSIVAPTGDTIAHVTGSGWVNALAWAPRGRRLLAAAIGRAVVVAEPDGRLVATYEGHDSTVTSLAWSPDARRLAVACYGGVSLYDPSSGGARPARKLLWKGSVLTIAYSPDGKWLVSGNQDATVHLWRLAGTDELDMAGYPAKIERLAFDASGRSLAVASVGYVTVWDMHGKGPAGRKSTVLDGHARRVSALAWRLDGILASGSPDHTVALWAPARTARPQSTLDAGGEVATLAWIPATNGLLVATASGTVARHDMP